MLRFKFWEIFHRIWGNNKYGNYSKKDWMELQMQLEILERDIKQIFIHLDTMPSLSPLYTSDEVFLHQKLRQLKKKYFKQQ